MASVGVVARCKVNPGSGIAVERFFQEGLAIVEQQPLTTTWFAFRLDKTTYGVFASFAKEDDRAALLSAGGPVSAKKHSELFAEPPSCEMVDFLEVRQSR